MLALVVSGIEKRKNYGLEFFWCRKNIEGHPPQKNLNAGREVNLTAGADISLTGTNIEAGDDIT
jgi:hypothetical protein